MNRKLIIIAAALMVVALGGCAQKVDPVDGSAPAMELAKTDAPAVSVMTTGSSDPNSKIFEVTFTGNTTITLKTKASYPHPTSLLMTFPGGPQTITWVVNLIRNGKTYKLVNYPETGTVTGQTFIWYLPNALHLQGGDQFYIDNGTGVSATAILNTRIN